MKAVLQATLGMIVVSVFMAVIISAPHLMREHQRQKEIAAAIERSRRETDVAMQSLCASFMIFWEMWPTDDLSGLKAECQRVSLLTPPKGETE